MCLLPTTSQPVSLGTERGCVRPPQVPSSVWQADSFVKILIPLNIQLDRNHQKLDPNTYSPFLEEFFRKLEWPAGDSQTGVSCLEVLGLGFQRLWLWEEELNGVMSLGPWRWCHPSLGMTAHLCPETRRGKQIICLWTEFAQRNTGVTLVLEITMTYASNTWLAQEISSILHYVVSFSLFSFNPGPTIYKLYNLTKLF